MLPRKYGQGAGGILEKSVVDFSKTPIWTKNKEGIKKCKKEREKDMDAVPSATLFQSFKVAFGHQYPHLLSGDPSTLFPEEPFF
ncbi:hypothetical protein ACTVJH_06170 [Desulfoplanes sp. PS50]